MEKFKTFQNKYRSKKTSFKWNDIEFNILNKNEIIDGSKDSETIESCNIGRMIRLPVNYNPGDLYNYLFIILNDY